MTSGKIGSSDADWFVLRVLTTDILSFHAWLMWYTNYTSLAATPQKGSQMETKAGKGVRKERRDDVGGAKTARGVTRVWVAAVRVSDMERAIQFYRDILGLPIVLDGRPGNAWVELGPEEPLCKVALDGDGAAALKTNGITYTGIVFDTDDIHALAARLREARVTFTHEPSKQPWGGWVADFLDPDRNELEVVYHPDHYSTGKT